MSASPNSAPHTHLGAITDAPRSRPRWFVRLLGAVEVVDATGTIIRFPSRAVAALLARLALRPDRSHPREELVELLWPGVSLAVGRNRLRQALSTLKSLLQPAGASTPPVIRADRMSIGVMSGAIECDAGIFERCLRTGDEAGAQAVYRGELMPGFYDEWVGDERQRLAVLHERLQADRARAGAAAARARGANGAAPVADLPSYWTRSFGIDYSSSRLHRLLRTQRLVTVHGPGGSGKTRLVVELARSLQDTRGGTSAPADDAPRFERVTFVALVDCRDVAQAVDVLCEALHVEGGVGEPLSSLVASFVGRRTLLVLDNLEQMVDAAGAFIARLLAAVPSLHVLATSRRLLEVDGEVAFELEGLPVPAADATAAQAAASPSVRLLIDRASAVRPDFRLDESNAAAVVALVRLLGGMPLAIELAATRLRGLTPQQLLERLQLQAGTPLLDLLARGAQRASADQRHASMRHVVGWSWEQLTPPQVTVLQAMTVFATHARPEAVAAVAQTSVSGIEVLLDTLRSASMVRALDSDDGSLRYMLLQPVREFAAERFDEAGARAARRRLLHWLIAFAAQAAARGPAAAAVELPHVHAAIIHASTDGDSAAAIELALALRGFWDAYRMPLSSLLALERALTEVTDPGLRADVHDLLAIARGSAGFAAEAVRHAECALELAHDDRRRSMALVRWVSAMYLAGRFDGGFDAALEEADSLAKRSGDLYAQASVLRLQALVACNFRLDFASAEVLAGRAQRLWERLGHRPQAYYALLNRATMWAWLGRNGEAMQVILECERASRAGSDWTGAVGAARQAGRVYIRMRQWDAAAAAFRRSVQTAWQQHAYQGVAHGLLHLPEALVLGGHAAMAARLQGFAQTHWVRLFHRLNRIEERELRRTRMLLHLRLGAARFESLRLEGSGMSVTQAVALALQVPAAGD